MPEPNANATSKSPAPPAYFLSLTVENFRCFKQSVTLDLSDGNGKPAMWNVLLGENGVGKTSLLRVLSGYDPDLPYKYGFHRIPVLYDMVANYQRSHSPKVRSSFDFALIPTSHEHESDAEKPTHLEISLSHWTSERDKNEETVFSAYCYGYGATRRMGRRTLSESLASETCLTLFDDTAELVNAEEWLLQADYASKTATGDVKKQAETRRDQVIELVCGILPEGGVTGIRFGLNEDKAVMTPRVEAKTPFGWVRLRDLSLGYQAALTWMVDLAARMLERYPDSPNPLAEPAIVLVDEIDLHLHPKWQRELITKLRTTFPKTQFIVTAHSPLIVQAAPDANIALLKRVGDHVEIENDVDHIRNWRADQILTSDLFGLESARPPHLDKAFRDREAILTKPSLTDADWKRLDEINREIGETPEGEKTGDMEAQNLVRRAAQLLRTK